MKTRLALACALLLALGTPASAHRLDEYLQATTISIEKDRVQAQMRLTPGVAVLPAILATIDTDRDGVISAAEQRAYADRVLHDLSLSVDGERLPLRMVSWKFGKVAEMKEGRGEIVLDFSATLPRKFSTRKLTFENHHQSRIAVYLVNCLVPEDPEIQVVEQHRNYLQSSYQVDYMQSGERSDRPSGAARPGIQRWIGAVSLVLIVGLSLLWRRVGVAQSAELSAKKTVPPGGGER